MHFASVMKRVLPRMNAARVCIEGSSAAPRRSASLSGQYSFIATAPPSLSAPKYVIPKPPSPSVRPTVYLFFSTCSGGSLRAGESAALYFFPHSVHAPLSESGARQYGHKPFKLSFIVFIVRIIRLCYFLATASTAE